VRLGAVPHLAQAIAVVGAFQTGLDRILLGPRLAQLVLQLGDVLFRRAQRIVEHLNLRLQLVGHVGGLLTLDQRGLGEILAVLRQRQLGLFGPAVL